MLAIRQPVATGNSHVSVVSLQLSVVQLSESVQARARPVQVPVSSQLSDTVQYCPSSQLTPVRGVQAPGEPGSQISHCELAGFVSPLSQQEPSMAQRPARGVAKHTPMDSLQLSLVQLSPSSHDRVEPTQVPDESQMSGFVQKSPSSQLSPTRTLKDVVSRDGSHSRHSLLGSRSPVA